MPEIILKTDMPDKAARILIEALETEAFRLKYSVQLAKKRLSKFENVKLDGNVIHIKMLTDNEDTLPPMKMRVYHPDIKQKTSSPNQQAINYMDLSWQGKTDLSVNLFEPKP